MAELADALDSGSSEHYAHAGSSPVSRTSELIRNDELAFLYTNPGPLPPFSSVFRRNTQLGLHHGPSLFVYLSDQPRRDFSSRVFSVFAVYRVYGV